MKPDRVQHVVAACCVLHNYLMTEAKDTYCPPGFADTWTEEGGLVEGNWRSKVTSSSLFYNNVNVNTGRPTETAKYVRDKIKEYVMSDQGALHWQNEKLFGQS